MESTWGPGMSRRLLGRSWMRAVVAPVVIAIVAVAGAARASATPLTEFNLPTGAEARNLIDGPDNALWFGETTTAGPALGRITTAGTITSTPILSMGDIGDLAVGAGGSIWFTLTDTAHAIGERTASGQITLITPGMDGLSADAKPVELTEGANGTVWFLDHGTTNAIGEIIPSAGSPTIIEYPTTGNRPADDLTATTNGNLWFTVFDAPGGVGFATPSATAGSPASVFSTGPGTMPAGITAGSDGNVWFSDQGMASIGKVTPSGTITEYGNTFGMQSNADPDALTAGPDGNVWFDDQYANNPAVGKITPAGQITEYPVPHETWDLTPGIDGNLWFPTGDNGNTNPGITRVTPSGQIDVFNDGLNLGAVVGDGTNIVSGPDGNLWFVDIGTPNAIVRADVQLPPTVTTGPAANVTASSAQINGSADGRGSASGVTIQYGTTAALGSTKAAGSEPADDIAGAVSATLTGLAAGTTIYYRLVANNTYGTVTGSTLRFTTAGTPGSSSNVPRTLNATVGNQRITVTLTTASVCLPASARLPVALTSTAIAGSKVAKLSFKHAVVFIDRGLRRTRTKVVTVHHHKRHKRVTVHVANATARHLPATLSPSLHGLRSGPHTLRIGLTFTRARHVKHRTVRSTVTKTIKTTFTVC